MPIREIIFLTSDKINGEVASKYIISCFLFVKNTDALAVRLTSACHKIIDWTSIGKPNFSLAIRSSASSSYVALFIDNILPFFYEVREIAKMWNLITNLHGRFDWLTESIQVAFTLKRVFWMFFIPDSDIFFSTIFNGMINTKLKSLNALGISNFDIAFWSLPTW